MQELTRQTNNSPSALNNFINAENGIQAATIENLNIVITPDTTPQLIALLHKNFGGLNIAAPCDTVSHVEEWRALSTEHYNLFVLENEEYESGYFSIPRDVSICKYMHKEDIEFFHLLSDVKRQDIFNMPCIFAKRNMDFRTTDENHPALLGRISNITVQRNNLKISFIGYQPIKQQILNENPGIFGLATSSLRTELDEEHWSIKRINLVQAIESLGIKVE